MQIEEATYPCTFCRTGVVTRWSERGMLSDPGVVLVADWVFHGSCWDGMVRENPPSVACMNPHQCRHIPSERYPVCGTCAAR